MIKYSYDATEDAFSMECTVCGEAVHFPKDMDGGTRLSNVAAFGMLHETKHYGEKA